MGSGASIDDGGRAAHLQLENEFRADAIQRAFVCHRCGMILGSSSSLSRHLEQTACTKEPDGAALAVGERVEALHDSPYTAWRKAGDVGTVTRVEPGGRRVAVRWDKHDAETEFDEADANVDPRVKLRRVRMECTIPQSAPLEQAAVSTLESAGLVDQLAVSSGEGRVDRTCAHPTGPPHV